MPRLLRASALFLALSSRKCLDEGKVLKLSGDLVGMVRETMQPAHVSLWLRSERAPKDEQAD
jgi:hypothetical protein